MNLIVVGTNHCTAPVEIREQYAVATTKTPEVLSQLTGATPLKEAVILSTCNRVEVYALTEDFQKGIEFIFGFFQSLQPGAVLDRRYFFSHEAEHAVQYLFEVTSGLNSMVLGETEVTGQVKEAYRLASQSGSTGFALNKLFQKSFEVAKIIRSSSKIGEGSVSVGSVAADLAIQIFGDLNDKKVLLLGAGNMSATTARALNARGCKSIIVSNRQHARAKHLAGELGGQAAYFEEWPKHFLHVDIMITSTAAPHPIVSQEVLKALMEERQYRPVFLIDIAVPRDIERGVGDLENIYLYDIDDLKVIADENLAHRQKELIHCKDIVHAGTGKFMDWFNHHQNRFSTLPPQAGLLDHRPTPSAP